MEQTGKFRTLHFLNNAVGKVVSQGFKLLLWLTFMFLIVWLVLQRRTVDFDTDTGLSQPENNSAPISKAQLTWRNFIEEHFAFDEACQHCHTAEYEAHQRSGHSRTATKMQDSSFAEVLISQPYQDPQRNQAFHFQTRDGLLFAGIVGVDKQPVFPVHWVLGSGKHAQTPVSIDPVSGQGVEFRWSWFAHENRVGVTPDHERFDEFRSHSRESFGRPLDAQQALACVNCHMSVVPPQNVAPTQDIFVANVNCERCHGPRKEHVRLAEQGRASESQPMITYDDPEAYLKQCAQCHRDESNIPAESPPSTLARYQPFGLQNSKCYMKSSMKMTCSTCHNPHDEASHDTAAYISVCNQCHQASDQVHCSVKTTKHTSSRNCIACHMPAVEWHSGIKFHDHWIRIPETNGVPDGDLQALPTQPPSASVE